MSSGRFMSSGRLVVWVVPGCSGFLTLCRVSRCVRNFDKMLVIWRWVFSGLGFFWRCVLGPGFSGSCFYRVWFFLGGPGFLRTGFYRVRFVGSVFSGFFSSTSERNMLSLPGSRRTSSDVSRPRKHSAKQTTLQPCALHFSPRTIKTNNT